MRHCSSIKLVLRYKINWRVTDKIRLYNSQAKQIYLGSWTPAGLAVLSSHHLLNHFSKLCTLFFILGAVINALEWNVSISHNCELTTCSGRHLTIHLQKSETARCMIQCKCFTRESQQVAEQLSTTAVSNPRLVTWYLGVNHLHVTILPQSKRQ